MSLWNSLDAFESARREKEEKYADVAPELSIEGKRVRDETIGSLGSWDPNNDSVSKKLRSEKYAKVMKRTILSETIAYSQDIFSEHTKSIPQDSGGRQY